MEMRACRSHVPSSFNGSRIRMERRRIQFTKHISIPRHVIAVVVVVGGMHVARNLLCSAEMKEKSN